MLFFRVVIVTGWESPICNIPITSVNFKVAINIFPVSASKHSSGKKVDINT